MIQTTGSDPLDADVKCCSAGNDFWKCDCVPSSTGFCPGCWIANLDVSLGPVGDPVYSDPVKLFHSGSCPVGGWAQFDAGDAKTCGGTSGALSGCRPA
jgi:hypothetical protein